MEAGAPVPPKPPSAPAASAPASAGAGLRLPGAPLIGRDDVLARLEAAADEARRAPRVVTLVGPAGMGKSRILREFLADLRGRASGAAGVASAAGAVSSAHATAERQRTLFVGAREPGTPHGVVARLLRARFDLTEGADVVAAQARVRATVAEVLGDRKVEDVCHFLGPYLGLSFGESPLTRALADEPQDARAVGRSVLRNFLEGDARLLPLVIALDDLHAATADDLEILGTLADHLAGPVLLVTSARPEIAAGEHGWLERAPGRHEVIQLRPLDEDDAVRLARVLLGPCVGGPPAPLVEAAQRMAGGNPGLMAAMVHIFHDVGVIEPAPTVGWTVHPERLGAVPLPLGVEEAVAARIAGLSPEARTLLSRAAVIGSVFWVGALLAVQRQGVPAPELWLPEHSVDREALHALLAELTARDHILCVPDAAVEGDTEYVFKHNREREQFLGLIGGQARREIHETVAEWLERQPALAENDDLLALLAHHQEAAGDRRRAGLTLAEAADRSRQRYALRQAEERYAHARRLLGESALRRQVDLLHDHGATLQALGHTDDAVATFTRMREVAWRLGLEAKGGAAENRLGRLHRDTGNLGVAQHHLDAGRELFEAADDQRGVAASLDDLGKLLWLRGDYEEALERLRQGLEMRQALGDRRAIALSLNNIGLVWLDHGRPARAREALGAALVIRREVDDTLGIALNLDALGRVALDQRELDEALRLFQEAHALLRTLGDRNRAAVVLTHLGETHYRRGEGEQAIALLTEAEAICDELSDRLHLAEAKRALAKAHLLQGDLKKARESIKAAVDLFGQVRSRVHLCIALRTLGEVTAARAWGESHEGKAVDYFLRSIALAKEIGNDLETAKSYQAFAEYVRAAPQFQANHDIQREAQKLAGMARDIFEARRIQPSEPGPASAEGER